MRICSKIVLNTFRGCLFAVQRRGTTWCLMQLLHLGWINSILISLRAVAAYTKRAYGIHNFRVWSYCDWYFLRATWGESYILLFVFKLEHFWVNYDGRCFRFSTSSAEIVVPDPLPIVLVLLPPFAADGHLAPKVTFCTSAFTMKTLEAKRFGASLLIVSQLISLCCFDVWVAFPDEWRLVRAKYIACLSFEIVFRTRLRKIGNSLLCRQFCSGSRWQTNGHILPRTSYE